MDHRRDPRMAKCEYCGDKFSSIFNLNRHMRRRHPNRNDEDVESDTIEDKEYEKEEPENNTVADDRSSSSGSGASDSVPFDDDDDDDDSDNEDDACEKLLDEEAAWRLAIKLMINKMRKKEFEIGDDVSETKDLLTEPYLSEIVKDFSKHVETLIDAAELIDRSTIYQKINERFDAIEAKHPNISCQEAVEKAWLKKKYDVREILTENSDLFEKFIKNVRAKEDEDDDETTDDAGKEDDKEEAKEDGEIEPVGNEAERPRDGMVPVDIDKLNFF